MGYPKALAPPVPPTLPLKFIYSEKATKFCEIFPLLSTVCTVVKSKGNVSQNFVTFSEYINFNTTVAYLCHLLLRNRGG